MLERAAHRRGRIGIGNRSAGEIGADEAARCGQAGHAPADPRERHIPAVATDQRADIAPAGNIRRVKPDRGEHATRTDHAEQAIAEAAAAAVDRQATDHVIAAVERSGKAVAAIGRDTRAVGADRDEAEAAVPVRGAGRVDIIGEREIAAQQRIDPLHAINIGQLPPIGRGARPPRRAEEGGAGGKAEIGRAERRQRRAELLPIAAQQAEAAERDIAAGADIPPGVERQPARRRADRAVEDDVVRRGQRELRIGRPGEAGRQRDIARLIAARPGRDDDIAQRERVDQRGGVDHAVVARSGKARRIAIGVVRNREIIGIEQQGAEARAAQIGGAAIIELPGRRDFHLAAASAARPTRRDRAGKARRAIGPDHHIAAIAAADRIGADRAAGIDRHARRMREVTAALTPPADPHRAPAAGTRHIDRRPGQRHRVAGQRHRSAAPTHPARLDHPREIDQIARCIERARRAQQHAATVRRNPPRHADRAAVCRQRDLEETVTGQIERRAAPRGQRNAPERGEDQPGIVDRAADQRRIAARYDRNRPGIAHPPRLAGDDDIAAHEGIVRHVERRGDEPRRADAAGGGDLDSVGIDQKHLAVGVERAGDRRAGVTGHAVEQHRLAAWLDDIDAVARADRERLPVDDRAIAALADRHRAMGRRADRGIAAHDLAAGRQIARMSGGRGQRAGGEEQDGKWTGHGGSPCQNRVIIVKVTRSALPRRSICARPHSSAVDSPGAPRRVRNWNRAPAPNA